MLSTTLFPTSFAPAPLASRSVAASRHTQPAMETVADLEALSAGDNPQWLCCAHLFCRGQAASAVPRRAHIC